MKKFITTDFNISNIRSVYSLKEGNVKQNYIENNRPGNGIAFYLGGERKFTFSENKKIIVKKNTVIFLPKGTNYSIKEIEPSEFYIINFDVYDNVEFEPFAINVKKFNTIYDSYKNTKRIWNKKTIGYKMKAKSELYNIIYNLQRELEVPYSGKSLNKIKPAIDYIHSNYDKENISVLYLSELCNMSSANLRNIFLKNFNLTPIKYINELKMALAEELLSLNFYTVKEVCFRSGFQDESYFSREFKKKFSITPSEYAKTSRN